jgi:hypothetical protein
MIVVVSIIAVGNNFVILRQQGEVQKREQVINQTLIRRDDAQKSSYMSIK